MGNMQRLGGSFSFKKFLFYLFFWPLVFKKISVNTLADHKQKEDFSDYISQRIETSAKSSLVKSLNVLEPQFIATETDPEA